MSLSTEIKSTIQAALPDATVYVHDPDGEHFTALVISPSFEGVSLIKQHKLVMNPLKEAFATTVHALGLKTFTPAKWEVAKDQYISN